MWNIIVKGRLNTGPRRILDAGTIIITVIKFHPSAQIISLMKQGRRVCKYDHEHARMSPA